jgi:hypothetical protein
VTTPEIWPVNPCARALLALLNTTSSAIDSMTPERRNLTWFPPMRRQPVGVERARRHDRRSQTDVDGAAPEVTPRRCLESNETSPIVCSFGVTNQPARPKFNWVITLR